jgi:hypothetical protein
MILSCVALSLRFKTIQVSRYCRQAGTDYAHSFPQALFSDAEVLRPTLAVIVIEDIDVCLDARFCWHGDLTLAENQAQLGRSDA